MVLQKKSIGSQYRNVTNNWFVVLLGSRYHYIKNNWFTYFYTTVTVKPV